VGDQAAVIGQGCRSRCLVNHYALPVKYLGVVVLGPSPLSMY
jgi:hypothetical protein